LGHDYGDQIILKIASINEYVAKDVAILLHFGGDEFVLLHVSGGTKNPKVLAENINHTI
jgi:GGDEF domain-containing protein